MAPSPIRTAAVVTAAGSSRRFGGGEKKELVRIEGRSVLDLALSSFIALPALGALVVTAPAGREAELRASLSPDTVAALERLGPGRFAVVPGGETRRDSVRLGLEAVAAMIARGASPGNSGGTRSVPHTVESSLDSTVVLVHDGARPWATTELSASIAAIAAEKGACVPIVPLVDTPKELGPDGLVTRHPSRASLGGVQTPQGFLLGPLLEAHRRAAADGIECTDDAELWDRYVGPVSWVAGDPANRKVTLRSDLAGAEGGPVGAVGRAPALAFRIGQGWDLHRLVPGRRLMLGGIEVPSELGEDAHSDGDALLHAIIDALLGAAALGDIGTHFPPSDPLWKDADSRGLARRAAEEVRDAGWEIGNLDCTVVLERPRLGPHRDAICDSIAACLGVDRGALSFKAKTSEGVDAAGEGRAVEAQAIALLFRP
jgi:2-C-methyl-D-erythritol 4-phosphate cytidylyltransferase / 2-C-methyl-D-erythritol 2,4-cyclodiphosphate synthase